MSGSLTNDLIVFALNLTCVVYFALHAMVNDVNAHTIKPYFMCSNWEEMLVFGQKMFYKEKPQNEEKTFNCLRWDSKGVAAWKSCR